MNNLFFFSSDRYGKILCFLFIFYRYGQILWSSFLTGTDKFYVLIYFRPVQSNPLFLYLTSTENFPFLLIFTGTDKSSVFIYF